MSNRRTFLKNSAMAAGSLALFSIQSKAGLSGLAESPEFSLPPLGFEYGALEPHIDALTMEIHYSKHHKAYVDNLNKALVAEKIENKTLGELLKNCSHYPAAIRNNGGGHFNHSFFWKLITPGGSGEPSGKLKEAINSAFGSFENLKTKFNDAAKSRFGSGWAWLIVNKDSKLEVGSSANQDNPLMDISELKGKPVLGLDVWEHAYYLHYQNRRPDYINAWWNVVNWNEAARNFSV
ncbi:MAG TPA: superoxide dismutase [Bacteroidia bacterium]|nr:superoxide dismutase [Bacteroidia bacterium]